MEAEGRKRVVIENVQPEIDCGRHPIKRIIGEPVTVEADVFGDGHDLVVAVLLVRKGNDTTWQEIPMRHLGNDRWRARFTGDEMGRCTYTVQGWVDHFLTWQHDLHLKFEAGQKVHLELLIGAELVEAAVSRASGEDAITLQEYADRLEDAERTDDAVALALGDPLTKLMARYPDKELAHTYEHELEAWVEQERALFSSWYEFFPRSFGTTPGEHGTFRESERLLPGIAEMGFDVIYLPPIHPIGETKRKGKNNSPVSEPGEPGSPWAIGSKEGGHKAVNPQLGTLADFEHFVQKAAEHGIEVAIDLAYQASPDHPYVTEHPEWFRWRPDGTVQYAENPPKKYEDVLPFNFESDDWRALWEELKSVVLFWIDKGVRTFRVDNPHTKPFRFWEWLIDEVKRDHPDIIFLSEAFARPRIKYEMAKIGFTQSYTYFTWRNTKYEFIEYMTDLTQTELREYCRPNFWPNTPDILPENLQFGGRPAFMMRLVLAATLSSNYGMYGPAFELLVDEPVPGKGEYLNSEKYEIKQWDLNQPGNLRNLIARMNRIRRENAALQSTWNIRFYDTDNDYILAYGKASPDMSNIILTVVNLDPFHTQSGFVRVPLDELGIPEDQAYLAHDLLSQDKYLWNGEYNYIELNPQLIPAQILRLHPRMRREQDFDYFL
jgi:starch synthase (maltosyl-transferring)